MTTPSVERGGAGREPTTPTTAHATPHQPIPIAVLLCRLFLIAGWGRAAAAKLATAAWWDGTQISAFLDSHRPVGLIQPALDHLVAPRVATVAAIVVGAQVLTTAALCFRRTVPAGLAIGLVMNLAFILAGAVNPSVFYIVLTMVVIFGRAEYGSGVIAARRARPVWAVVVTALLTAALAPHIETIQPDAVIHDPAAVLIFMAVLATAAVVLLHRRRRS